MLIDISDKRLYNEKYIPLFQDRKRYLFLMWWWWSWKSVFESQKEIAKSFQIKNKIMCVRKIKDTIKDSVFAELISRIHERKLEKFFTITTSPMSIVNNMTWCRFIFRWVDDPEKLKSVEWVERVWIEEATELKKEDFDQIDLRLRGKDNMQITCTFNPTDAEHRLNTDFRVNWNTDSQTCLHSTYKDNKRVWETYANVMDRLFKTNPNYYNIYALWQRWVLEWLIFNWRDIINEVPEDAKFVAHWLDFWYTNDPTAFVSIYLYNNELILDERFYEKWLTNVYKDESQKEKSIVWKLQMLWIDEYDEIWADSSEPKSIDEIHWYNFNIKPVVKWKDSITYGIDVMQQYKINITARSWNLQKEFKKYVWAKDKNWKPTNNPIDAFNHWIDASRYGCMSALKISDDLDVYIW